MAHLQHPTSIDISNEDYSVEIYCLQEYQYLDDPYTRFPHEVTLEFVVETLLVSSSNRADRATYQSTTEEVSVPSVGIFSPRCGDIVKKSLDIAHIPFALSGKNIEWFGMHARFDPKGSETNSNLKLLGNLQELVSEIVGYLGKIGDDHCLPLENMVVRLNIKKLVAQPASVVALWTNWSLNMWDEYYEFAFEKPLEYLRRKWVVKTLEKLRQQEGKFDPEEICCICMEGLSENESGGTMVTRLHCSHMYHESCILGWFVVENSCPYCRAETSEIHNIPSLRMDI